MIAPSADVADTASIGEGTKVWHLAQVREGAVLGQNCIIGRGAYIGTDVHLGNGCKVQNYALVYEPAYLADGVFIGPAAVLTNDQYPRAVNPDGTLKSTHDWQLVGVTIKEGASIGARAICVAPLTIGRWASVAAGAVVTRDVPDFALVAGVPARRIRWVGKAGVPLESLGEGLWQCPQTGQRYAEHGDCLLELGETARPREGSSDVDAAGSIDSPADSSADSSAGDSAGFPADSSAGNSVGFPADSSAGNSVGFPAGFPDDSSAGFPADSSAGFPADSSAGFPADSSAGFPADFSADSSVGDSVDTSEANE